MAIHSGSASEQITHRSVIWKNRAALVKGSLCLLAVDCVLFSLPYLIKLVIDRLQNFPMPKWLPHYWADTPTLVFILCSGLLYLSASALCAFIRYWWRVFLVWSTFPHFHEIRRMFFQHLQNLHRDFFKAHKIGDLLSALTTDTENIRMTLSIGSLTLIDALLNFMIFPVLLWELDWKMASFVVPPLILISGLALLISERLSGKYEEVQQITADLSGRAFELSSGIRIIKAFRREKEVHADFVKESKLLRDASLKVAVFQNLFAPTLNFALSLSVFGALLFGGFRVLSGTLSVSTLVAFQIYLAQMDWPMMAIGWFIQMYRQSQASQKRVQSFVQIQNPLAIEERIPSLSPLGASVFIEIENLDYTHPALDMNEKTLTGLKLQIQEKDWIGLTGPVGSGKTTFLELLSRQRDPSEGKILFKGRDLRSISLEEVRTRIVYIPQEAFLFSRSLKDNLSLGLTDSPSEKKFWQVLNDLHFHEDELRMRGGLLLKLGERGTNFSGGQRQRLSLGRALLRSRDLFLFDDVFSHVDAETESKLLAVIRKKLEGSSTVFLVSQRIETLSQCQRILVLNEGRVEFFGSFSQALEASPFLKRLIHLQRDGRSSPGMPAERIPEVVA